MVDIVKWEWDDNHYYWLWDDVVIYYPIDDDWHEWDNEYQLLT